jgi:16S rRNA (cytosine967-C5)-methyltransferase
LDKDKLSNPRWLAVKTLLMVLKDGKSLDVASEIILSDDAGCDTRDLALYQELIRGTCRWFLALRLIITPYLRKPFKAKDLDLEIIMIIGLYQILLMRIDDHAAVNESVKLVHRLKKDWSRGLVNAVLRQVIRDGINIEPSRYMDSYPEWMQKKLARDWPRQFRDIAQAGNNRAPLTLRVDLRRNSTKAIIDRLLEQHINASLHEVVDSAITLEKPCEVTKLEVFNAGLVSVQDAAAQLAAGMLDCKPGMRVLDACAAPGGKTAHLLQYSDDLDVVALDIDALRLTRIEQNLARVGRRALLVCGDAANPGAWHDGVKFDRILADVPCSGSGVMRRHPDIKLLRRESDIPQLVNQQKKILSALWPLLKPGGLLLYSTCSIFKDENELQIGWFVENHVNCTEKPLKSVQWGEACSYGRQILPGEHNMDGFFYACLQKVMADDI